MSNSTSFSKLGYLALKKETTAGTAVKPDVYLEILEESIQTQFALQPVEPISGKRDARLRSVKDKIEIGGDISLLVDAKTVGYLLTGALGSPTTTTVTSSTVYQHVFTPQSSLKTFTMDVAKAGAGYVYRYVGVRIETLEFSQSDNIIQADLSIQAQKSFTNARVLTSANSGTALVVDQTSGLTTSDTLQILDKDDHSTVVAELTISSITNETTLVVSTIGVQIDVDDIVVIKKSTPSYSLGKNMTWIGGSDYKIGTKSSHPVDNTATINAEDYSVEIENALEVIHAARGTNYADRFPSNILLKEFRARGSFTKFWETISQYDDLRNNSEIGTRIISYGDVLNATVAQAATLDIGTGANGTVTITADTAGREGEDYNVTITVNTSDALSVTLSGNNITVALANTTAANNTATLVAAAIAALSGVTATASGTGADSLAIAAVAKRNLGDTQAGREVNERESLQISFPKTKYEVFGQDISSEDIINQEISFEAEYDDDDTETVRVVLRNGVSAY